MLAYPNWKLSTWMISSGAIFFLGYSSVIKYIVWKRLHNCPNILLTLFGPLAVHIFRGGEAKGILTTSRHSIVLARLPLGTSLSFNTIIILQRGLWKKTSQMQHLLHTNTQFKDKIMRIYVHKQRLWMIPLFQTRYQNKALVQAVKQIGQMQWCK